MKHKLTIDGRIVMIESRRIVNGRMHIQDGKITSIEEQETVPDRFILPGFVDAHVHIESSMLCPAEFARLALRHGTVATVSDPHEIANVCGLEGIGFMVEDARRSPLKFHFGAPSCVPATPFETSGASLDAKAVEQLLQRKDIHYLSEMMNFPGVLTGDREVFAKIQAATKMNKPVDGHAPGLRAEQARQYAAAGIQTDHECTTVAEAEDKLAAGMYILIREGSAAKNFDTLVELLASYPRRLMFCSDDKHPDELLRGHINELVRRAIQLGYDLYDVLHAACILPVRHYNLDVGLLRPGDPADFILTDNLQDFTVSATFINGEKVAEAGKAPAPLPPPRMVNNFKAVTRSPSDFGVHTGPAPGRVRIQVIHALDGQLTTLQQWAHLPNRSGELLADPGEDILKIAVVNRYEEAAPVSVGFIRNFGLKKGAIASSVAHDSHNIVVVGVDEQSMAAAVNAIIRSQGGISAADGPENLRHMPLPIAGLMSVKDGPTTAAEYEALDARAKTLGSTLSAPFMTLSFMALPVIPHLKITDKGLFDVDRFEFTRLEP